MTESEFLQLSQSTLQGIETSVENALISIDIDIECTLSGNVLEIDFVEKGTKIIINSQLPMKEIWVAAPSGGYHFRYEEGRWMDARSGAEFHDALNNMINIESGGRLALA